MKILVLGGAGMLGHKMFQILRDQFPGTLCTTRKDVRQPPFDRIDLLQGDDVIRGIDATNFDQLEGVLNETKPDYVINCIGVVKQRDLARVAIPTITINSLLPHKLAVFADKWGGRVIQPSTDCVFDGARGSYAEEDRANAEDLYGKSKFLGELHYENALTLRTSIVGRELTEHRSLLDWFLSQQGKTVRGFRRVIYAGVTTNELSEVVSMLIQEHPELHGLYQVVSEAIPKYELLCKVRDIFNVDITITPDDAEISNRSMRGDRFRDATGYIPRSWDSLIERLAKDPTPYRNWVSLPWAQSLR